MAWVALVTLLLVTQYLVFMGMAGRARAVAGIEAPAMVGDARFERALRVQLNTLEQLAVTLPAMWVCALWLRPDVAAVLGMVFLIGRALYCTGYLADPRKRGPGMLTGFLANVALILAGLWGVGRQLLG